MKKKSASAEVFYYDSENDFDSKILEHVLFQNHVLQTIKFSYGDFGQNQLDFSKCQILDKLEFFHVDLPKGVHFY